MKTEKMDRQRLLAQLTNGKFFSVTFFKTDGTVRSAVGKLARIVRPDSTDGYLTVEEFPPKNPSHRFTTIPIGRIYYCAFNKKFASVSLGDAKEFYVTKVEDFDRDS